jgi:hypothetical protein
MKSDLVSWFSILLVFGAASTILAEGIGSGQGKRSITGRQR